MATYTSLHTTGKIVIWVVPCHFQVEIYTPHCARRLPKKRDRDAFEGTQAHHITTAGQ